MDLTSAALWSWIGSGQAFIINAILTDGRHRVAGCWAGLITEPVWIATPFVVGNGSYGYAVLGLGWMLSYVWGIVRRDRTLTEVVRPYLAAVLRMPR